MNPCRSWRSAASAGPQATKGCLPPPLPKVSVNGNEISTGPTPSPAKETRLSLLFRDHRLSDLIGFTYSRWEQERAADDFVARLEKILKTSTGREALITIILDGENAWEYYPENGYPFLSSLYRKIAEKPGLHLTTPSEHWRASRTDRCWISVHPGSWINAPYGIWIGHPEENSGWDYLEQARQAAITEPGGSRPPGRRRGNLAVLPPVKPRPPRSAAPSSPQREATGSGGTGTIISRPTATISTVCSATT